MLWVRTRSSATSYAALRGERIFPDRAACEGIICGAGIGGERFGSAQHSIAPARLAARRVKRDGHRRLLDVGGGSGDNPTAECLTPGFVEGILREAVGVTEIMPPGITKLTRASRPA